jgi:integrase/recombinase XerD
MDFYNKILKEFRRHLFMVNTFDYPMPSCLKDFLNYMLTIKGKSANTVHSYFYDLRLFFRFMMLYKGLSPRNSDLESIDITAIDIVLLNEVTLSDLYEFMSYVSSHRDNSAYARARKVASLKSFYKFLKEKAGIISNNPTTELETPKIAKRLPRYLELNQSKALLSSVTGKHAYRDYAMISLFLNCGMRLSELVGIDISDISASGTNSTDRSLKSVVTITGKGNKERSIHLNEACINAINDYLINERKQYALKPGEKALFLSEKKKRISKNMVQYIVKRFLAQAGLDTRKYSTHKLRHTAATLMYKYGKADIRALQMILGHESIATTEIYTHLDDQQLKDAIDSNPLATFSPENMNI